MSAAPPRNPFASPWAALALLALAVLLPLPVARLAYSRSHLERQGIDIVGHLIIAHQFTVPGGHTAHTLNGHLHYPATSHRLAAWSARLLGGDLLLALRYASAATMLALLALPYVLFCRFLRPWPALAVLLAWHLGCFCLKVDGLNHFLWEGQFNYSRGVGTVAFWLCLIALSSPAATAPGGFALEALAILCACFALACHIAPGAVTFGTLGAFQAARWLRGGGRWPLLAGAAAVVAGGALVLGTNVWVYMVENAHDDGWLPVGPHPVLLLWVPTLLAGLALFAARLRRGQGAPGEADETALLAALLASGVLQAYLTWKMVWAGTCAPYAVKSIYFFTFPVASLLAVRWAAGRLGVRAARLPGWACPALAGLLGVALVLLVFKVDTSLRYASRGLVPGGGKSRLANLERGRLGTASHFWVPASRWLPDQVCRRLKASAGQFAGYYYYDPAQPYGSYYATVVELDGERQASSHLRDCIHEYRHEAQGGALPPGWDAALVAHGFAGVLLPETADPARVAPGFGPPVKVGDFWMCPAPAREARR